MITIKSKRELQGMQKSGRVLAAMFEGLRDVIKPGISTWEIEEFAQDFMKKHGGRLSEQGFEGYKYGTCISVNDEIAHAIPRKDKILKEGDLVSVDVTCNVDGYETDSCTTYGVGEISAEDKKLMDVTKKAMYMGIDQAVVGNRIGDIGSVMKMAMVMYVNLWAMVFNHQSTKIQKFLTGVRQVMVCVYAKE